jgi:peptide subunit release factor RF-3
VDAYLDGASHRCSSVAISNFGVEELLAHFAHTPAPLPRRHCKREVVPRRKS